MIAKVKALTSGVTMDGIILACIILFLVGYALDHWGSDLSFTKANSPILTGTLGTWDATAVHPVGGWVKAADTYYFLYQGFDASHWRVGVLETMDFVHWYKWPQPILDIGGVGDVDGGTVENAAAEHEVREAEQAERKETPL